MFKVLFSGQGIHVSIEGSHVGFHILATSEHSEAWESLWDLHVGRSVPSGDEAWPRVLTCGVAAELEQAREEGAGTILNVGWCLQVAEEWVKSGPNRPLWTS